MRNLAPSTLSALPAATHNLAELELAYNTRRRSLVVQVDAASLAGRQLVQPSMAWTSGPRTQPRDGRGRFLSATWLAQAETFTPSDLAWFRGPIGAL